MTRLQKLQFKQSEARSRLAALLDTAIETRGDTFTSDLDAAKIEVQALESEIQAALLIDDEPTVETRDEDSEGRELRSLIGRSTVGAFLNEAATDTAVDGAERELRQALSLGSNQLPIDVLLDNDLETRADVATDVTASIAESQRSIAARVFAGTSGAFLGWSRPTVGIGDHTFVALTAGATADARVDGARKDSEAATFTTKTISPFRVSSRYLFGVETTVRVSGVEDALRADLRAVIGNRLDAYGLLGKAAVANTSPAVEGLLSALADPTDPTAIATADTFADAFLDRVDGKYSSDGNNVRLLVNPEAYRFGRKLRTAGGALLEELPPARFRASANMPDTASTIAKGITYAAGRVGYVQPVWRALSLVRDPYTNAAEGQVAITAIVLIGGAVVDSAPYSQVEFKLA